MTKNINISSSKELQNKCKKIYKKETFHNGINYVPDADVTYLKNFISCDEVPHGDFQLKMMIAQNRYMNKICDYCWNKKNPSKLLVCSGCYLTFYCNIECQRKHWNKHKLRCRKTDGPLDDGPQKIIIFEKKNKNNIVLLS